MRDWERGVFEDGEGVPRPPEARAKRCATAAHQITLRCPALQLDVYMSRNLPNDPLDLRGAKRFEQKETNGDNSERHFSIGNRL